MENLEEQHLKKLVRNSEERFEDWKQLLTEFHKLKLNNEEYKEILRDGKNSEESWLKSFREELTYHRQGMNPPSFYPY